MKIVYENFVYNLKKFCVQLYPILVTLCIQFVYNENEVNSINNMLKYYYYLSTMSIKTKTAINKKQSIPMKIKSI